MGLLRAFDLDFVMTNEHEWGCDATLAGVAIYQLSTRPGIDAVGVVRAVWNGSERALDLSPLPAAATPHAEVPLPTVAAGDDAAPVPALPAAST